MNFDVGRADMAVGMARACLLPDRRIDVDLEVGKYIVVRLLYRKWEDGPVRLL